MKNNCWGIKEEDQLRKNSYYDERTPSSRKVSRRKSSINPSNVELVKRNRFNSKADELEVTNEENPELIEELVKDLDSDLEFYQCFILTVDEIVLN